MKLDKDSEEEGEKRGVKIERRTVGTKKGSPDGLEVARAYPSLGVATLRITWLT